MKFLKFSLLTAVLLSVVFAFSSCGDDKPQRCRLVAH